MVPDNEKKIDEVRQKRGLTWSQVEEYAYEFILDEGHAEEFAEWLAESADDEDE